MLMSAVKPVDTEVSRSFSPLTVFAEIRKWIEDREYGYGYVLMGIGHANHILPWFEGGLDGTPGHDVCAVAGCDCECANL